MPDYEAMAERLDNLGQGSAAKMIRDLLAEVRAANARERRAFVAGYNRVNNDADSDLEQAWQQYRCQDDTDWKVADSSQERS